MRTNRHRERVAELVTCRPNEPTPKRRLMATTHPSAFVAVVILWQLTTIGCNDSSPPSRATSAVSESPQTATSPDAEAAHRPTADEAVRRAVEGLRNRKARAVWDFLPPSHRQEVQQLVRDVARRLDEPTWKRLVSILTRTRATLRRVAKTLPADPSDTSTTAPPDARRLKLVGEVMDLLLASEFGDLKRLQEIDLGHFWETTGTAGLSAIAEAANAGTDGGGGTDPLAVLSRVEVRLVTESRDSATVEVRWPKQPATEHQFVRVEGQWIPQSLTEAWPAEFAAVRNRLLDWAEATNQQTDWWNAQLQSFEQRLDAVEAATDDSEASRQLLAGVSQLLTDWFHLPNSSLPDTAADPPQSPTRRTKVPDNEELLPDK